MSDSGSDSKVQQTKDAAANVAGQASSKAADVASTAKQQARSVVGDASDQVVSVLGTGRDALMSQAGEHAKTVSSTLGEFSEQLQTMADSSDQPDARVAELARSAADTLGRGARRLDEGGVDGLLDDVKRLARNRPGVFLLGSVAAGFAVGRLVKHSDVRSAMQQAKSEVAGGAHGDEVGGAMGSVPAPAVPPLSAGALSGSAGGFSDSGGSGGSVNDPGLADVDARAALVDE